MRFEWKVNQIKNDLVVEKEKLVKAFRNRNTFRTDHPCFKIIAKRKVERAVQSIRDYKKEIGYWSVQWLSCVMGWKSYQQY